MEPEKVYGWVMKELKIAGIDGFRFEAKVILEEVKGPNWWQAEKIPEKDCKQIESITKRRAKREPLQYIIGNWEFWSFSFEVGPGVLIPRPETELLVELALKAMKGKQKPVVVDLCSGSGCVGLSLAKLRTDAQVLLIEKDEKAYEFLKRNVKKHESSNSTLILADIFEYEFNKKADVVTANPPYLRTDEVATLCDEVRFEPKLALDGGEDGLEFYRGITQKWANCLRPGGCMILEFGVGQGADVARLMEAAGLCVQLVCDLEGRERVAVGF